MTGGTLDSGGPDARDFPLLSASLDPDGTGVSSPCTDKSFAWGSGSDLPGQKTGWTTVESSRVSSGRWNPRGPRTRDPPRNSRRDCPRATVIDGTTTHTGVTLMSNRGQTERDGAEGRKGGVTDPGKRRYHGKLHGRGRTDSVGCVTRVAHLWRENNEQIT